MCIRDRSGCSINAGRQPCCRHHGYYRRADPWSIPGRIACSWNDRNRPGEPDRPGNRGEREVPDYCGSNNLREPRCSCLRQKRFWTSQTLNDNKPRYNICNAAFFLRSLENQGCAWKWPSIHLPEEPNDASSVCRFQLHHAELNLGPRCGRE